uniref:Man1/Src1-like C-terminal domain-containing protein n=1 Tax=Oryza brachyantha TaxID=4533 RepID=J3LIX8_ORYBR
MPSRSAERPRRRRSESRWSLAEPPPGLFPDRDDLLRLLAVLSIAAAAAAACSLLSRRPKPFCDSNGDFHSSAAYPVYIHTHDSCQPCPQHGRCVDGNLECVQGFKKYGRMCVEDGLVTRTAKKISELLERRICDQHARALCGQPAKILFKELDISNVADELLSKDFVGLSQDGVKLAKIRVLENAEIFLEKTMSNNGVEGFKCTELVAELYRPMTCQLRQWIYRNMMFVIAFGFLFSALLWIVWSIYRSQALAMRAEQIYGQVCEILEDNATNAKIGNSDYEPWVVTSWLRDHLLVPQERRNAFLWKKVEELIVEDSRIDQYPKVIKGESKVVYEWQASGSLRGKSKRMQFVAEGKSRAGAAGGAVKLAEELGLGAG